jgi:glycosyltransferase involved in cell wall biosynthesis
MKDHAGFVRAALQVLKRRPGTRFLLLGRDVSFENPALMGIVPDALADRFIFLGERPDAHQLMHAMDILCMSSAWGEAFPNVLGEAMASGVPCVGTDVGDSANIIGDTGRFAPPGQPYALAEALLELLAMSSEERVAIGCAARQRIEARYALPAIVSQYADMYNQLARRKQ